MQTIMYSTLKLRVTISVFLLFAILFSGTVSHAQFLPLSYYYTNPLFYLNTGYFNSLNGALQGFTPFTPFLPPNIAAQYNLMGISTYYPNFSSPFQNSYPNSYFPFRGGFPYSYTPFQTTFPYTTPPGIPIPYARFNYPTYVYGTATGQMNEVTLIHIGDLHGHLIPRVHLRSDGYGQIRGGLARLFTKISDIRRMHQNSLLVNTGDTIQGSAEALYTEGGAIVDVVNMFRIDAFAPGNWDYLYGPKRFLELFGGATPLAPWNAVAANLYYSGEPYSALTGQRVLPAYIIRYINGLKIGILGFTARRGPQVIPASTMNGFMFTDGHSELVEFTQILKNVENVDLLVMISELGLAENVTLAELHQGIDVILSSDMHEETRKPVITSTGAIVVEEGQDGTVVGELTIRKERGHTTSQTQWQMHIIESSIQDDPGIAQRIAQVRRPFVTGPDFRVQFNPINSTLLKMPIDTVIGYATVGLHRSNFAHEDMPAVVEGSSHDFITDTFRTMAQADVGAIRGFRYGTHVPPGPIRLEDIYHFIPIGPLVAVGRVTGLQIKTQIENSADGSLKPDVFKWGGGWLYGWSGLSYDLDPYASYGNRAQNIQIMRWGFTIWEPLNLDAVYTYASYYYTAEPAFVNQLPATNIQPLLSPDGNPLDATEVIAEYLKTHDASPELNRIRLLQPLPPYRYGNAEIQPLWGASP